MEFNGPAQPNLDSVSQIPNWGAWALAAFALFRLFDIWKPGPIGWSDKKLTGGTGIMMDDVLAGILTTAILHGVALIV